MNKKWKYSTLNCVTFSTFEGVSSDHRIVTAKIRLRLRRNAAETATTVLNGRDIRDKYTLILRNKFHAFQDSSETLIPNEEYENFVNAHWEAAAECILTKQKVKPRVSRETAVRKKRADVKTAFICNRRNPTNINAKKFKKTQHKLTNVYLKRTNRIHTKSDQ